MGCLLWPVIMVGCLNSCLFSFGHQVFLRAPWEGRQGEVSRTEQAFMATTRLYIGGVPYSSTEDSLRAAFEQAGPVTSAEIVMDRQTGRSRGFAFVEIDAESADKAIEMWDGKEFEGRTLTVSIARAREERGDRQDFRR